MNEYYPNMEISLRLEEEKDYRIVEELTREAFWNLYIPGYDEHLLVHNLRKSKEYVKNLDFVKFRSKIMEL
jgi:predicted N-acetyltransferase YhbS